MGIETTFQPKTPTYLVDSTAAVAIDGRQSGVTSWRIKVTSSDVVVGHIKWAPGGTAAPTVAVAPALGVPAANTLGLTFLQTLYIEGIGAWIQFIGDVAGVPGAFEVTGGQGGIGG